MGSQKLIKTKSRIGDVLKGLSPIQHGIVAFAIWFLSLTIIYDALTCLLAALRYTNNVSPLRVHGILLLITFNGTTLPLLAIFQLCPKIHQHRNRVNKRWPTIVTILSLILGYIGLIFLLVMFIGAFFMAESLFAASAWPFTTSVCAFLWLVFGKSTTHQFQKGRRLTILAVFILAILAVRYIDLNSRKPFTRNLFQVHKGMTGVEVEKFMGQHLHNWYEEEHEHYLYLDPNYTGAKMYRHTIKWWGDAEWGMVEFKDGRVVDAEICLGD